MWKGNLTRALSQQKIQRSTSRLNKVVSKSQLSLEKQEDTQDIMSIKYSKSLKENQTSNQFQQSISYNESVTRSKSIDTIKHLKVEQVLNRWYQMQRLGSPIRTKDSEQPKYGDLKIEHINKFNSQTLGSEQSFKYLSFSPQSSQGLASLRIHNQQETRAVSQNNSPSKSQDKEVLRVKQLRNQNCRPIRNMGNLKFEKSQSSLLLKRKKEKYSIQICQPNGFIQNTSQDQDSTICTQLNKEVKNSSSFLTRQNDLNRNFLDSISEEKTPVLSNAKESLNDVQAAHKDNRQLISQVSQDKQLMSEEKVQMN